MATLANIFHWAFDRSIEPVRDLRPGSASAPIPHFANEDIYFFTKRIDNSRVVRSSDPKAHRNCWKLMGSAGAAVILLIGVLLPGAYSLMAGFQVQSLRQEEQRLATEHASLELEEAQQVSPARMEELARIQQFIDPPSAKVVYLDSKNGSLALNDRK